MIEHVDFGRNVQFDSKCRFWSNILILIENVKFGPKCLFYSQMCQIVENSRNRNTSVTTVSSSFERLRHFKYSGFIIAGRPTHACTYGLTENTTIRDRCHGRCQCIDPAILVENGLNFDFGRRLSKMYILIENDGKYWLWTNIVKMS